MGKLNILGLSGLTAEERKQWELENINKIAGLTESLRDRIYRNQQFKRLFKPEIYDESVAPKDPIARAEWDKQLKQKQDEYERLISTMTPLERDEYYALKVIENYYKGDSREKDIMNLHPTARYEFYLNPDNVTDAGSLGEHTIEAPKEDTRGWFRKAWDTSIDWALSSSRMFGLVNHPLEAVLKGGTDGAIVGGIVGLSIAGLTKSGFLGLLAGSQIGGFGLANIGPAIDEHNRDVSLDEAKSKSIKLYEDDTLGLTALLQLMAEQEKNVDPNAYYLNLYLTWNELTEDNNVYRAFKNKSAGNLSIDEKEALISKALAIAYKYGFELAQEYFNDALNDIISTNQGSNYFDQHLLRGFGAKLFAGFGETGLGMYHMAAKGLAEMPFLSEETRQTMRRHAMNFLRGFDGDGNKLPWWISVQYFNGVDKYGTWDPNVIDDIQYDINSQEFKDFIADGGTRDEWMYRQELTGEFKGTGVSTYKRLRSTEDLHAWLSADAIGDATDMGGYILNQYLTSKGLGKLVKGFDKYGARFLRGAALSTVKQLGTSPRKLVKFRSWLTRASELLEGGMILATTSIPISMGYGLTTYEGVMEKGSATINDMINKSIEGSVEYQEAVLEILNRYDQMVENGSMSSNDARNAANMEIKLLYDHLFSIEQDKHKEDYERLRQSADDAYLTDFTLEMYRNIGNDLAFRSYLYKDATKMIRGARPNVHIKGEGWGLKDAAFKNSILNPANAKKGGFYRNALAAGKNIERKLGNKVNKFNLFNKYIEKADGTIVRNAGFMRNTVDITKAIGKNVTGGFWSNYMDDVTVGFSEGLHLHDFNDYINKKYHPEIYKAQYDNFLGDYLAGIHGGAEAMLDKLSFMDGYIGALGSVFSFTGLGLLKHGGARMIGKEFYRKHALTDSNGRRKTTMEILYDLTGNPILGQIANVQSEYKNIDERLESINKRIIKNKDKLGSVNNLLYWMHARSTNQDWASTLDMKDSNQGLGFAILDELNALNTASEGHSKLYARYMKRLLDLADGKISDDDINAFIFNPENRHILESKSIIDHNGNPVFNMDLRKLYAYYQILNNALKLLDLNTKYRKNLRTVEQAFGEYSNNSDAATLLAYSLTMQDSWNDRLRSLNKELTGTESYTKKSNEQAEYGSYKATYDRISEVERLLQEEYDTLAEQQEDLADIKRLIKEGGKKHNTLNKKLRQTSIDIAKLVLREKDTKAYIKLTKRRIAKYKKRMSNLNRLLEVYGENWDDIQNMVPEEGWNKSVATRYKELSEAIEKDSSLMDRYLPLSKEEIMNLNPELRADIILNPENYNTAQQKIVEELLREEESKNPNFKEQIRDAGILFNRIEENKDTIQNIIGSKEDYDMYSEIALREARDNAIRAWFKSDEFKKETELIRDRKALAKHYSNLNQNKWNILYSVLKYLQRNDDNVDIFNTASLLEAFDRHSTTEEFNKYLQKDETLTLTPANSNRITMGNIRDMLLETTENYTRHKNEVERREQDVVVPVKEPEDLHTRRDNPTDERNRVAKILRKYQSYQMSAREALEAMGNRTDGLSLAEMKETIEALAEQYKQDMDNAYEEKPDRRVNREEEDNSDTTDNTDSTTEEESDTLEDNQESNDNPTPPDQSSEESNTDDSEERNDNLKEDNQRREDNLNRQEEETPEQEVERVINSILSNVFGDKEGSGIIEFYNPFLWDKGNETILDIKEKFRNLFTDINRMEELLAEYQKMDAKNRPKVYFYVPSGWHADLQSRMDSEYVLERMLPVVAIVEDGRLNENGKGCIRFSDAPNAMTYTPIGLAPVSSYANEWQNENKSMVGQHRTEALRKAAVDNEGKIKVDLLLTTKKDGKDVYVTSEIVQVKKHYPSSMGNGEYTSVSDIALNKLGYTPLNEEDIFSGFQTVKDSSLYQKFRKFFLSHLVKDTDSKGTPRVRYEFQYEGTPHYQQVFVMPILKTMVTIPAGITGNTETRMRLLDVLRRDDAASILLTEGAGLSKVLSILADRINYALKQGLSSEKISIDDGKFIGTETLEEELNKAFKIAFNNRKDNSDVWNIEVSKAPRYALRGDRQITQVAINLVNHRTGITDTIIKLDLPTREHEDVEMDNNDVMQFIKNFMFEENGMGEYRGESTNNPIEGFRWGLSYTDLNNYSTSVNEQESNTPNRMGINKINAYFDDGIISLSQDNLAGFNPMLTAPFNTEGRPAIVSPVVVNDGNVGEAPVNNGDISVPDGDSAPSMISTIRDKIQGIVDNILEYSRKRAAEILAKREAAKLAKDSVKNHISATAIAGILYDSEFSEDNPYHIPSTTLGTQVDTLVRDFFLKDTEGNELFDVNNIDYSKYPSLSKEAIDEFCRGLEAFKDRLKLRDETIYTEEIITDGIMKVRLLDGRIVDVPNTGHLDMLTVDRHGKFHVYDMKSFLTADNFLEKAFGNYATQLNIYKNLLENQWGIKVDSIKIIPIELNYPEPNENNVYTKEDGYTLKLNGDVIKLDENQIRFGMEVNIKQCMMDLRAKVKDEHTEMAEKILKAVGFNQLEIEQMRANKISTPLGRKIRASYNNIELDLSHVMTDEVEIDINSLSERQRLKLEAIVENVQKENGALPSKISSAKTPPPLPTIDDIESDNYENLGKKGNSTPNAATNIVGRNDIPAEENATNEEVKDSIEQQMVCFNPEGKSKYGAIFDMIE